MKEENFGLKIRIYMLEEEAATLTANLNQTKKADATLTTSISTPHLALLQQGSRSQRIKKPASLSIYDLSEDSDRGSHSTTCSSDTEDADSLEEAAKSSNETLSSSPKRSGRSLKTKQRSKSEKNLSRKRRDSSSNETRQNEYETLNKLVSILFTHVAPFSFLI